MLFPVTLVCPYCGESIELSIDGSLDTQHYVEDCHVCCQPIEIAVTLDEAGEPQVSARTGDDA